MQLAGSTTTLPKANASEMRANFVTLAELSRSKIEALDLERAKEESEQLFKQQQPNERSPNKNHNSNSKYSNEMSSNNNIDASFVMVPENNGMSSNARFGMYGKDSSNFERKEASPNARSPNNNYNGMSGINDSYSSGMSSININNDNTPKFIQNGGRGDKFDDRNDNGSDTQLRQLQMKMKDMNLRLTQTRNENEQYKNEIIKLKKEHETSIEHLKSALKRFKEEKESLKEENERLKAKNKSLVSEKVSLQDQNQSLERQKEAARNRCKDLAAAIKALENGGNDNARNNNNANPFNINNLDEKKFNNNNNAPKDPLEATEAEIMRMVMKESENDLQPNQYNIDMRGMSPVEQDILEPFLPRENEFNIGRDNMNQIPINNAQFYCRGRCQDYRPNDKQFVFGKCKCKNICKACATDYIANELDNKKIEIDCPVCRKSKISEADITKADANGKSGLVEKYRLLQQPQSFECPICQMEMPIENVFVIGECEHQFCRECAQHSIKADLSYNRVIPRCPTCLASANKKITEIAQNSVELVLEEKDLRLYHSLTLQGALVDMKTFQVCFYFCFCFGFL